MAEGGSSSTVLSTGGSSSFMWNIVIIFQGISINKKNELTETSLHGVFALKEEWKHLFTVEQVMER